MSKNVSACGSSLRLSAVAITAGLMLTGCESSGDAVTPDSLGYKALMSGDYTTAQSQFQSQQAEKPHDPYVELDLAVAYQQLGRLDLAEALNRQAMADGKNTFPAYTTFERDKGKSIADIACENIAIGRKTPSC